MLVERIDPDWQWTKYRKVLLSRDDGPKVSYPSKYRPAAEASTLHRSFAKAFNSDERRDRFDAYRFTTTKIKNRDELRDKQNQLHENWLTSFGKLKDEIIIPLGPGDEFDELHFNKEAGYVWWIVQVFDVLRANNMDPEKVKAYDAFGTMIDIPNPAQVASDDDNFFPFQRAVLDPPPDPVTAIDGTVNDHSSYIRRNIPRDQDTWSVNYSELLEVLAITISRKLQDGINLSFESLDRDTMPVAKGSGDSKGISITGFPFLNVPRGRYGNRGGKVDNPLDFTHKIDAVLQPKDLLTFIWMLCAEELTELPHVVFENCKAFEFCGNTIKRPALRPCKYCRLQVSLYSDPTVNDGEPILANVHDVHGVTVDCDKSGDGQHEWSKPRRDWCSSACQHKNRKN